MLNFFVYLFMKVLKLGRAVGVVSGLVRFMVGLLSLGFRESFVRWLRGFGFGVGVLYWVWI